MAALEHQLTAGYRRVMAVLAGCPCRYRGSEEKDLAGMPAIGDRRVSGIHDRDSRFHLTQPEGTGSKMWRNPGFMY